MNYVPFSILYVGITAENVNGQSVTEPNWGLGRRGWYLVDQSGDGLFGPFATEEEAVEELTQFRADLERGIA
jgi:hypothetical protein